ncbi:uncharacterized protein LOC124151633 [Haliotis rufescens]|uniref:uncharacterized protein LOC124151633 n=1 Tax=Haliotis rufescens TaxID=6454 RepID=UPI00201EECA7|nr:uncharacterized protein LOC124151633 [Haliotis rufescens]
MAGTSANNRRRVFWTNTAMDSSTEDSDAYVPGLSKPGNMRQRVKGRKTPEVKANISLDRPAVEDLPPGTNILLHDLSQSLDTHSQRRHQRKASFKDLRMEDKKRVANLIKELAKAGDEKEKVLSQLHEEREQYDQQILQLVAQQEEVLKEKEDVHVKLFETQQLLTKYQEQIIEDHKHRKHKTPPVEDNHRSTPQSWRDVDTDSEECFKLRPKPVRDMHVDNQEVPTQRGDPALPPDPHRPYTSLIDQEIALHRQQENRPHGMQHEALPSTREYRPVAQGGAYMPVSMKQEYRPVRDIEYRPMSHGEYGPVSHGEYGPVSHGEYRPVSHGEYGPVSHGEYNVMKHGPVANLPNGRPRNGKKSSRKMLGPLREPIMSSTQKSSQIFDEMSFNSLPTIASENYQPLPLDDSPRTTFALSGHNGFHDNQPDNRNRNRVGFVDHPEDLDSARVHSPVLEVEKNVAGDREFMEYYKKLTPAERKRELLRQRAALLEEQIRLKHVLVEQETQLREKQVQLNHRQQQQLQEKEFHFKPVLTDIDDQNIQSRLGDVNFVKGTRNGQTDRHSGQPRSVTETVASGNRGIEDLAKRLEYSGLSLSRSNSGSDISSQKGRTKQMKSAGTSPINSRAGVSIGTSPVRLDTSGRLTPDIPDLIDAGTSVSYRHIPRSPQQSNLPLPFNRQRTSPSHSKGAPSPGDKTLAILELVNSIEKNEGSLDGSVRCKEADTSLNIQSRDQSLSGREEQAEDLEESKILEEVFFLK